MFGPVIDGLSALLPPSYEIYDRKSFLALVLPVNGLAGVGLAGAGLTGAGFAGERSCRVNECFWRFDTFLAFRIWLQPFDALDA